MPPVANPDGRDDVMAARAAMSREMRRQYADAVGARINSAVLSDTPFMERMVHFWANHFAVSADKLEMVGLAGPFEFEAIRPNLTGKFSAADLVKQATAALGGQGGGGRPDMAQGGGPDGGKATDALAAVRSAL